MSFQRWWGDTGLRAGCFEVKLRDDDVGDLLAREEGFQLAISQKAGLKVLLGKSVELLN